MTVCLEGGWVKSILQVLESSDEDGSEGSSGKGRVRISVGVGRLLYLRLL